MKRIDWMSGGTKRLFGSLAMAAAGIVGLAAEAGAEPCYMLRLTQVELNAAGGASDFAVPDGPNKFKIVVKASWPQAPALMSYMKLTFAMLPGTDPALLPLIKAAGGAMKVDGNYAGPLTGWQGSAARTQVNGWPTPDPKSSTWPNGYPNQVWFETGPVSFQNCTVVRSQIATLSLDARDLLHFQGEVPRAGCQDCPQLPQVQAGGIAVNPAAPALQAMP